MCGIAGIYLREPGRYSAAQLDALLDAQLRAIDHRGGDATGVLWLGVDGGITVQTCAGDARDFIAGRRRTPEGTRAILAHTRAATQGSAAWARNNHPVRADGVYVVHNGWIVNDDELLDSRRRGKAEVDSLAIAAVLADVDPTLKAQAQALELLEGALAIASVDRRAADRVLLARGCTSPLVVSTVKRGRVATVWGSIPAAVEGAWTQAFGGSLRGRQDIREGTAIALSPDGTRSTTFKPQDGWSNGWTVTRSVGRTFELELDPVDSDASWSSWRERIAEHGRQGEPCDICGRWTANAQGAWANLGGGSEWICGPCLDSFVDTR